MSLNIFKKLALVTSALAIIASTVTPLTSIATAADTNLIANPSVETADSTGTSPLNWKKGGWGTNTSTLSYKTIEGKTGTKSLYASMTAYTSGDAKWYFNNVSVNPSQKYTYTEAYKSNVSTDVTIQYTSTTGVLSYVWLGNLVASSTAYTPVAFSFTTPSNVKTMTVFHTLNKVGWLQTDDFSLTDNSAVTPPPATAPTVSLNSPLNNTTVSGTAQAVNATVSADTIGVQFKLDGVNVGSEDTSAPFSTSWNTTTAINGAHTVSATARNASGLTATATANVTVQNTVVTPPPTPVPSGSNLIANPSFENSAIGTSPDGWSNGSWGTNTATFTYLTTGHTGNRSVKTTISGYSNGAASWHYPTTAVTAGKTYKYENWYQSNVDTEVDAEVTMNDGSVQYFWLGAAVASTSWTKFSSTFVPPAGAKSIVIYQLLAKNGYIVSDDYSLSAYTPARLGRAIVSLTFDDGWRSIYTNGLPVLKKYGFVSTQYLNSQPIVDGYPDYMTYQMVKDFASQGSELAWHTRTHADLTKLSATKIRTELSIPSNFLTGIGQPSSVFKNFATPFGAYNATSLTEIKKLYGSHRSTDVGFNSKDSLDVYNIKVQNITNTTTPAQVQTWVNQAIADGTWLVLVYHEVTANAEDPTYAVTPTNLDLELNYIKQSGISVQTVQQALNEIKAQQ